nr:Pou-domain protein [Drosophila melanogaster]prf//1709357A I-POU protein [Drosophila sp. (in: flies)]
MTMSMYSTTDKMKMSAPSCFPGRYSPSYRSSEQMRRCMPNPSIHISSSCDSLEGDIFAGINDGILSRAEALAAVDIQKHQAQHVHSQMPSQIKHDVMYHHHSMSGPPHASVADAPLDGPTGHAGSDGLDDHTGAHLGVARNAHTPTPARFLSQHESHDEPPPSGHVKWPHGGTSWTLGGTSSCYHRSGSAGLHPDTDTDPRELEAFAERFKQRRIKLGVTQADVGKALANLKLPGVGAVSQSTICRFESLTLSHNNMIALKPILQAWLEEAEAQAKNKRRDPDAPSVLPAGEKKRTSIAAPEKRSLEAYFAVQPRPSGEKIAAIAEKLDLKKNVVRVWFCNQRQKQKRIVSSVTPSMTGHGSAGFGY